MGGGGYDYKDRVATSSVMYASKSAREIFTTDFKTYHNSAMNPNGVAIRESRDSEEHPNSVAIVLALDTTGSMGTIPDYLVRTGLPEIMDGIIKAGVPDPQMLFLGVGDHECDRAPLQVGQFESSDKLLDHWLTSLYLEGGGGGNAGESYLLAWYFAGYHTSIDCFEKREKKGYLFTIGDEPTLMEIPNKVIKEIMGEGQYQAFTAAELLEKARESYHVFHIHMRQGSNGTRQSVIDGWTQLIGPDHLIIAERKEDVKFIITKIVCAKEIIQTLDVTPSIVGEGTTPTKVDIIL